LDGKNITCIDKGKENIYINIVSIDVIDIDLSC